MNNYEIMKTNVEGYDRFVICLSSEGLMDHMNELEGSLSETETDGKVLIDQLLITGDGANRFMSCQFSDGKFDFKTAHTVDPTEYYRNKTVEFLHDNNYYVENSILTDAQRQKINSFEPDDEQLYARNHTQRVSQTNVAREAVEQDLDPEHVEAMKRYYEADNNDELVEIMGDDDSLFEAHTEDGKVLEGKEALMQNVNKIHDENLTMNFGAGLDDLSDMGREYEYTLPDGKHVKVGQADGPYTTAYIDDNDENLTTDFGDGLDALSGDMEQRESENTLPDGMI